MYMFFEKDVHVLAKTSTSFGEALLSFLNLEGCLFAFKPKKRRNLLWGCGVLALVRANERADYGLRT